MINLKYYKQLPLTKKVSKIKYYSRNGEEQLIIYNNSFVLELSIEFSNIDLSIDNGSKKENYRNSKLISDLTKREIDSVFAQECEVKLKIKELDHIFYDIFKKI